MSKGSRPRPSIVSPEELAQRHESIFGKKAPRAPYVPPPLPDDLKTVSSLDKKMGNKQLPRASK
jgi:hypothetical protein